MPTFHGARRAGKWVAKKAKKYCKKTFTAKHKGSKIETPIAIACPEACADYLDEKGIWSPPC